MRVFGIFGIRSLLLGGLSVLGASWTGACGRQFNDCTETYTCAHAITGGTSGAAAGGGSAHVGGALGMSGAGGALGVGGSVGGGGGGVGAGGDSGAGGAIPSLIGGMVGVTASGGAGIATGGTGRAVGGTGGTGTQPVTLRVPACIGADINAKICTANTVVQCTGTRVGEEVERCISKACVDGGCVGTCQPGTTSCVQGNSSTCTPLGALTTPVSGTGCRGTGPSCAGLAATCGPLQNESCCESPLVPAYATQVPAQTPYFLDRFEVTVGRFSNYVAAFDAWRQGGGLSTDPGWNSSWTAMVAADAATLLSSSQCQSGEGTWSLSAKESSKPMNCLSWYNAQAFCHWDGGALPLEADWQFAATRAPGLNYPWGATVPDNDTRYALYGCWLDGVQGCSGLEVAPVGSVPTGNGPYGHADLSGNLAEWVLDAVGIIGQTRGGSWDDGVAPLTITQSVKFDPTKGSKSVGFRCRYPL